MGAADQPGDRISSIQLSLLTIFAIMGSNYLVMPRMVASAGGDGWLALIVGGVLSVLVAVSITRNQLRFPGETLAQYPQKLVGPFLGKLIALWVAAEFVLMAAAGLRLQADTIKLFLLNQTPMDVIMVIMLFTAAYAVLNGIQALARLSQVFFPLILALLIFIFLLLQTSAKYQELLPVASGGWRPLASASFLSWGAYIGFGHIGLTMAFLQKPRQGTMAIVRGQSAVILIYVVTYILAVAVLGVKQLQGLLFPVPDLVRAIEFPVFRIERAEGFMLVVWLLASYMALIIGFWGVALILSQVFGFNKHEPLVYPLLPLIFILARIPANPLGLQVIGGLIFVSAILLAFIFGAILPAIAFFKERRVGYG